MGSCWVVQSGTTYRSISCNSGLAQYKVVSTVSDPKDCPDRSNSYLDTNLVGSTTRIECLVPLH